MKTTFDIPDRVMEEAIKYAGAKTKREAVLTAMLDFNRRMKAEELIAKAGAFPDFPSKEDLRKGEAEYEKRIGKALGNEE